MEEWSGQVRPRHWKEGRSAYSLADFILNRDGSSFLEERISHVLAQPVKLAEATPEYRARFDSYQGNTSNLDLGIFGTAGSQHSLFVGIEAKVDERFGSGTVCQMYRSAGEKRIKTPSSKAAARIKGLLSNYFSEESEPCDSRFSEVGYQLLTGTAGTVATQMDFVVFYVMVFKTHLYDQVKGRDNRLDYERFIKGANGKVLMQDDDDFQAHEVTMAETRLVCVYDSFNTHGPD